MVEEILLVGNPNTGKTSLYNIITKSDEHVGNWHGVTVDEKRGMFSYNNEKKVLIDLPGIYSMSPLSFEEEVATNHLLDNRKKRILNICDINNLKKNLLLTLQLMELGLQPILIVNDTRGKKSRLVFDEKRLAKKLGLNVLVVDCTNSKNKKKVIEFINKNNSNNFQKPKYFEEINTSSLDNLFIKDSQQLNLPAHWISIKYLENDAKIKKKLEKTLKNYNNIEKILNNYNKINVQTINKTRFAYIDFLLSDCYFQNNKTSYGESKFDKIALSKFFAIPVFILIMLAIFYLTFFSVGSWISTIFKDGVALLFSPFIEFLYSQNCATWFVELFSVGVVGGISTLFSFMPQIVLLFLFLSILEDSGYLSRTAFVFDDIFAKIGLSGKSIYTLLMGFGCSTSACLTARNMEDKNSKIKTALLTPYMSCSAKLPIYLTIGGAFFGASNVFVILFLYVLGVVISLLLSAFFENSFLKSKTQSFILEFPAYRLPKAKRIFKVVFSNIKLFLVRVGSLLISMNIIIWLLQSFSFSFSYVPVSGQRSILEVLGSFLAPIFTPIGFSNWGITSALIAGLVAKEIIVSSIAIFNGVGVGEEISNNELSKSLKDLSSAVWFTPASCLSFLVFCLLYSPCLATMSVLSKEIGKKWTAIGIVIQFIVAYLVSFIVYNFARAVIIFPKGIVITFVIGILVLIYVIASLVKLKNKKHCVSCQSLYCPRRK